MKRRTFLKIAGMGSVSFAAGCTSNPEKTLYALVQAPDDMVTGRDLWYASTCRECPSGCGIIAKNREGRVVKVEGNPNHPINRGALCMRGQAALQGIYHPDRITRPLLRQDGAWQEIPFDRAVSMVRERAQQALKGGPDRVRMITETVGESLLGLFTDALRNWRSSGPLVFEPFAYESMKTANERIFGIRSLPSYRLNGADLLVGFGADFLETWLSPVAYAGQFKAMHAFAGGEKGRYFHVSPFQSLTGANADTWVSCRPGSEAAMALGLVNSVLASGRGAGLGDGMLRVAKAVSGSFTRDRVTEMAGVSTQHFRMLERHLLNARKPLVVGTGAGNAGPGAVYADMAVNLLNRVLDPDLPLFDFDRRHRVEIAATRREAVSFFSRLETEPAGLLLVNNANPVFAMPAGNGVTEALKRQDLFVVSFSAFMDETTRHADLVLPAALPLESWDEYGGLEGPGLLSTLQPAMGKWLPAPELGDVILRAAFDPNPAVPDYRTYLYRSLKHVGRLAGETPWLEALQHGGIFPEEPPGAGKNRVRDLPGDLPAIFGNMPEPFEGGIHFMAVPSIRFFDGRGADRPWLCEVPDPLTKVAWQTPVLMHPETAASAGVAHKAVASLKTESGEVRVPVYTYEGIRPGVAAMHIGQGHAGYGRYARGVGTDPIGLLPAECDPAAGGPTHMVHGVTVQRTGQRVILAHTDGSRIQHGRKIALSVPMAQLAVETGRAGDGAHGNGLTMHDFPMTLPLPQGYDPRRDAYPPHDHAGYRWGMAVDLGPGIGCRGCSVAPYSGNHIRVGGGRPNSQGPGIAGLPGGRLH